MDPTVEVVPSSKPLQFDLKFLLLLFTGVAVIIAPVQWFGGIYAVSAAFSIALIAGCTLAYRYQAPGTSFVIAGAGAAFCFVSVIGLLVFSSHALLNFAACIILLLARVRPRTFEIALIAVAAAIYGFAFAKSAIAVRELHAFRLRYPFVRLEERLSFERKLQPESAETVRLNKISPEVAANLEQLDDLTSERFSPRVWMLRGLHSEGASRDAQAAGFVVMRRMSTNPEYVLQTEPRPAVRLPLPIDLRRPESPRTELADKHRLAVLDFVERNRLGYVRSRDAVSGFEAHGFSELPQKLSSGKTESRWQVARLELVSLLRHDEPRVYIAATLPQMDQLDDVAHRALNGFEQGALPKLASKKDVVIDSQSQRIQMLGAIRAGTKCLECHSGERGALLGAFSYEIVPLTRATDAMAAGF